MSRSGRNDHAQALRMLKTGPPRQVPQPDILSSIDSRTENGGPFWLRAGASRVVHLDDLAVGWPDSSG